MRYILALIFVVALAMPVSAANGAAPNSGKQGPTINVPMSGAQAETVDKAKTLADDATVVLTGKIISQVAGSKDKFIFKDDTGEIQVEIDRKVLGRVRGEINPDTTVRISGKMDKDMGKDLEVEVKTLEIVN